MDFIEEVKNYCLRELRDCKRWGADPNLAKTRCYGAVMFVLNLFPDTNELDGLGGWWDNEMRPQFEELR